MKTKMNLEKAVSELVEEKVRTRVGAELLRIAAEYNRPLTKRTKRKAERTTPKPLETKVALNAKRGSVAAAIRKVLSTTPTSAHDIAVKAKKLEPGVVEASTTLSVLFSRGQCQRIGKRHHYKYFLRK